MADNNITFYQPMINENNQLINENNQLINENNNEGYITFFIRCWKPRNILKKIAITRNLERNIEQKKFLKNTYEGVQF